jgi:hypothetical protein
VFVLNPKAKMLCTDFYELKQPISGLKATQLGISADLGYLPTAHVKDINLLTVSESDLKKYVNDKITDEVREVFKKNGINNPAEHIWKNVVLLKTKNKPVKNASKRDLMPQTEEAKDFTQYTPNISKMAKGGGVDDKQVIELTPITTKRDSKGFRFYSTENGKVLYAEKNNDIYNVSEDTLKATSIIPLQRSRFKFVGLIDDNDVSNSNPLHYERETIKRVRKSFGLDNDKMAKGGVTFDDKVKSISKSLLKRKKVSPKVQKDYGKTYDKKESIESAKRIAGALRKKEMVKKKG